jgi:tetratricopeptide (TPR) repeat protein
VLLAVLAARPAPGWAAVRAADAYADVEARGRPWGRLLLAALLLGAIAVSAILPAWSAALDASAARTAADPKATADDLEQAASRARLAADLNPAAAVPLETAGAVAQRRARLADARSDLLEAAGRQPDRAQTWQALSTLATALADREGAAEAATRAVELDPMSSGVRALARRAEANLAPPESSPTATGTPLPAVVP